MVGSARLSTRGLARPRVRATAAAVVMVVSLAPAPARAGPPYTTDDPEPVGHRRWELYLASQHLRDSRGWSGTAPQLEVNYGPAPDVQLHLIAPLAHSTPSAARAHYGYGDTELGVKLRLARETERRPQVGTFPLVEAPTGSLSRGLGNGSAQLFLPLWLQKSFGPWTTYGGGGAWLDLGQQRRRWWYLGWQAQRRVVEGLSLGAELFHLTPPGPGDRRDTRVNLGLVLDVDPRNHLLLSGGRSVSGSTGFQGYVAYLLTLGPAQGSP